MKNPKAASGIRALAITAVFLCAAVAAASNADSQPSQPQAKVSAHLPIAGDGTARMFLRQAGSRRYLYVRRGSQSGFTVIDVTTPEKPRVVPRRTLATRTVMGSGLVVTETHTPTKSSLAEQDAQDSPAKAVRLFFVKGAGILNPLPVTDGASGVLDDAHGLVYVANDDGIWILSRKPLSPHHP